MDKNFTSLISDEVTIFSDKWQQYLIERKNIKKDILNTKDELNNLQEKRNESNNHLNLLQEDEKDRKIINIIIYFISLIVATISFIISKNLIATTILNITFFSLFRSTSYLIFGSKNQRKKDIKKLLDTIENYNKQIDKQSQKLNQLNNLKLKFNKSIVFKPIQEPIQTYAKTKKKIIK